MSIFRKPLDQLFAMISAVALHGGVLVWALFPAETAAIQQQVIQVSMVAPSVVPQVKQEVSETDPAQVTSPAPDGIKLQKKAEQKPKQVTHEKVAKKTIATPPTSGPQAVDATEKLAAASEPVFNASYLHNPPPAYPTAARRKGVQGKVMLNVSVTREGNARDVAIATSSGSSLLDEAARDAVQGWRFMPAKRGDEVVEARVLVPVEFKLN